MPSHQENSNSGICASLSPSCNALEWTVDGRTEWLAQAAWRMLALEPHFKVTLDTSPAVRASRIAAWIEHDAATIRINSRVLDDSSNPERLKRFLILHELTHALLQADPQLRSQGLELHWNEEELCDATAMYAIQLSS